MASRTKEEVQEYVEWQCQNNCKVINSKSEQTFTDLGFEVTVWNVKTDSDGSWWVVEGEGLPMNLYPQDKAYYFSADEAYSFHIGLMSRLKNEKANIPENIWFGPGIIWLSGVAGVSYLRKGFVADIPRQQPVKILVLLAPRSLREDMPDTIID